VAVADPVLRLEAAARAYAWGSRTAIPELQGQAPTGEPIAELWFGAHSDDPSTTSAGRLDELIAADPTALLGADVVARFGPRLPFLLKILAAERALSIQVHPNQAQAEAGYAAEQARGVPLDAPDRNYRDPFHKPELLCALTEFDALCGFRPVAATQALLRALAVRQLGPVVQALNGPEPLRTAFEWLLEVDGDDRAELIDAVVTACHRLGADDGPGAGAGAGAGADRQWVLAARATLLAAQDFPGDIGAVLALLLNVVRLAPGEAIFLGAGNVHAYLRGLGVEIMANSDNVLRCGLTPKHIDVAEVLRVADFSPLEEPRATARSH
jgi:mannose-6-phosphate isomerase